MAVPREVFPESEAWAASMPDVRGGFASSSPRKAAGSAAPASSMESDYKTFASLDLSNM